MLGRRSDGRYYPYSTRYGRRVGYGMPVAEKSVYVRGLSRTEAEQQLRAALTATEQELSRWLLSQQPARAFQALDRQQQEILLDQGLTRGVAALPADFCAAVLQRDWRRLIDECLYVRAPGGWPDYLQNQAFAKRWVYGKHMLK